MMTDFMSQHRTALQFLAYVLIAAATIFASVRTFEIANANRQALAQIKAERNERTNQICLSAEREHLRDVTSLRNTYKYLAALSDDETHSTFNRFIIAQVPQTEGKAKSDVAPAFCDEPGAKAEKLYKDSHGKRGARPVGLPEPDPVTPERPIRVDELIKQLAKQRPVIEKP